jgi:hypothetical protein
VTLFDNTNGNTLPDLLTTTYDVTNVWHQTSPRSLTPGVTYTITLMSKDDSASCDAHYTYFDDLNFSQNASVDTMMCNIVQSQ